MRALRSALPFAYRRAAAGRAAAHALRLLRGRKNVAVFLAQGSEIATAPLVLALLRRGHRIAAPRLHGKTMRFARLAGRTHLRANRHGILEPLGTAREPRLDAVLLPLLAFDAAGRRLGQGGGHYDRALANAPPYRRPLRVGFAFAAQQVDRVPAGKHDVRLQAVVTERGVLWATG